MLWIESSWCRSVSGPDIPFWCRSIYLLLGVGGNDVPKNSPLTLMKYKCFLAGYQKPAKLVFWCRSGFYPKFYTCWKIWNCLFFSFIRSGAISSSPQGHRCHNFQYFWQFIEIFWKTLLLFLRLKFCWKKWIRISRPWMLIQIRIHQDDPQHCRKYRWYVYIYMYKYNNKYV